MEIQKTIDQGLATFTVKGRLDSNTSTPFEKAVYETMGDGLTRIVINLEGLEYISSAGLRVILKTTKDLKKQQGTLVLCSLQDYVREVFEIAGFDTYLNIEPSLDNALAFIRQ